MLFGSGFAELAFDSVKTDFADSAHRFALAHSTRNDKSK
jgi:hypothetical protein